MHDLTFDSIVLAAGKSQRMGRNKLILQVACRPILDWTLLALDNSIVDKIFVVLGHKPEELRPVVEAHRAEVVLNTEYEKGMTSSVKAGLCRVSADATFLILGDQLSLRSVFLERMAEVLDSDPETLLVSPIYRGRRGHPILIRNELYREIMSLSDGETLRDVVERHEADHRLVEGDIWCITDIDTPDDFERAKRLFESGLGASPQ